MPEQLTALGVDAATDVSDVVLTHQHVDHTEAVPAFTQARLWTTAAEDAVAERIGSFPTRWRPEEDRIAHVDRQGHPAQLGTTVEVAPGIEAIHTPGHTPGSVTVRINADGREILLTGDTSFTAEGMDPCARTAGIHVDLVAVRRLQTRLASRGAVLLPAHDPKNADRLEALASG